MHFTTHEAMDGEATRQVKGMAGGTKVYAKAGTTSRRRVERGEERDGEGGDRQSVGSPKPTLQDSVTYKPTK